MSDSFKNNKPSKIQANWEALNEFEGMVRKATEDPNAKYNADLYSECKEIEKRDVFISVKYRLKNTDGSYANSFKEVRALVVYCPFTGKPLYDLEGFEKFKQSI